MGKNWLYNTMLVLFSLNAGMLLLNIATDGGGALIGLNAASLVLCGFGMSQYK